MKKIKAVYDCSFSWLGTGISIKSDRDKLVSWAQKTSSSDCWWPQDDNEHVKYMTHLAVGGHKMTMNMLNMTHLAITRSIIMLGVVKEIFLIFINSITIKLIQDTV
jgi:hypothetical protein